MPVYNIISKKLKQSQFVVQKVDDGKPLRTVLPFISKKLGIPSMKNYVAFACSEKRPVARLDMDIPLGDQGVYPSSYIYISPIDATPKGPDGEELPFASELKKKGQVQKEGVDIPPPPPPLPFQAEGEEENGARRQLVNSTGEAGGGSDSRHTCDVAKGHTSFDSTQSMRSEHKVQLKLVPDVITIATEEDTFSVCKVSAPGNVVRKLVSVASGSSLHHAVLLQIAELLISNRPSRPQLFLWSHLQGKLCGSEAVTRSEKRESRSRTPRRLPTFAPVGDTVHERLLSGLSAGPARAVLRYWAKVIFDAKPDNPLLFMWSKLEAKNGKDFVGAFMNFSTGTALPEDRTKAALLRNVPRGTPIYTILRNIVDLMFEKKPDLAEVWILHHLISRSKSNGPSSGRSSVVSCLHGGDETSALDDSLLNYRATGVDGSCNDNSDKRMHSVFCWNCGMDSSLLGTTKSTKPQAKDASTQTACDGYKQVELPTDGKCRMSCRKRSSIVSSANLPHDRTPRQLLHLPPTELLSLPRRGCNVAASDLEPFTTLSSPYEKFEAVCDPLRYSGTPLSKRSSAFSNRRCFSQQDCEDFLLNRQSEGGEEKLVDDVPQQSKRCLSLPCDNNDLSPPPPPLIPSCSEAPGLAYAVRRCEVERAETLYEHNWLVQRELLRTEQLEKEVECLQREMEIRKKMLRRSPSTSLALEACATARAQAKAQARLAKLRQEGVSLSSELDTIRKRLRLLDTELACSRSLFSSPRSCPVSEEEEGPADDAPTDPARVVSAVRSEGGDC